MKITKVDEREYAELLSIWECCYIDINPGGKNENGFERKMKLGNDVIDNLDLRCIRSITSEIIGFIGIYNQCIELFCVLPIHRSIGVGEKLLRYAIDDVSVNSITLEKFRIMNECFY
jgi:ribosomal protein S18 acetylase RimI-like enzyme